MYKEPFEFLFVVNRNGNTSSIIFRSHDIKMKPKITIFLINKHSNVHKKRSLMKGYLMVYFNVVGSEEEVCNKNSCSPKTQYIGNLQVLQNIDYSF